MIGLQAPLIPTRSATSSPQPPPPPASSRPPNASDASLFATPVTFPSSSTSQHCRQPSTASSDDFGDFVASDPLGAASAAARDASDDVPTDDLLQFSPVRERFLDGAARRVEEKREHLLGPLEELDGVNRPGFVPQNTGGFGSEPRLVPGSTRRRLSSTSSGGVRPIMSPPRRLSHIMASPDPAPRPPPSPASSSTVSHAAGVIPSLLKTKSKWTSLLSSPSASTTPHAPNANADLDFEQHVTHTTPFHSHLGSAGPYVPPSGAPGFRPDDAPREGSQWDDLDERGIELVGRRETTVGILSSGAAEMLRPHLPPRPRLASTWTLLYSLDQHGSSLQTLYSQNERWGAKHKGGATGGVVLCVEDSDGGVFGGWVNETFRVKQGSYYGSGECFLYKFHPFRSTVPLPASATAIGGIEVFRPTFVNSYFILSTPDFLSLGGGDGKYGLYVDRELMRGTSARCPCFANEVLCTSDRSAAAKDRTERFEIVGVEVWGVGD